MPLLLNPTNTALPVPLFLVDDHDEAYRLWKEHAVRNEILLHFDAHIDFEWIADKDPLQVLRQKPFPEAMDELRHSYGWSLSDTANNFLHLGNYLCRALEDGMIREWYWVVPDSLWEDPRSRRQIWRDLQDYFKYRTGPMEPPRKGKNAYHASFFKVPFTVTSSKHLPKFDDPVLLNIDVDYLTTEIFREIPEAPQLRRKLPWIWPDDFASLLQAQGITSKMTTLSNSVRGGFTPIQFKFFGEALRQIELKGLRAEYFELKRAYRLYAEGRDAEALAVLESFQTEGIYEASRLYRKAQILDESGHIELARESMQNAARCDPEFHSTYNSAALFFEAAGRLQDARDEYRMIHRLLPDHAEALLSKADGSADGDAEAIYLQVLTKHPGHAGAAQKLGNFYLRTEKWALARLFLALAVSQNPKNIPARIQLAKALILLKDFEEAKKYLRETLGLGGHLPEVYFLLAKIYWNLGFSRKAAELWAEAWRLRAKIMFRHWRIRFDEAFAI